GRKRASHVLDGQSEMRHGRRSTGRWQLWREVEHPAVDERSLNYIQHEIAGRDPTPPHLNVEQLVVYPPYDGQNVGMPSDVQAQCGVVGVDFGDIHHSRPGSVLHEVRVDGPMDPQALR